MGGNPADTNVGSRYSRAEMGFATETRGRSPACGVAGRRGRSVADAMVPTFTTKSIKEAGAHLYPGPERVTVTRCISTCIRQV